MSPKQLGMAKSSGRDTLIAICLALFCPADGGSTSSTALASTGLWSRVVVSLDELFQLSVPD
ncbi:hypothetical protein L195_g063259, partial [Trifolium pratense]